MAKHFIQFQLELLSSPYLHVVINSFKFLQIGLQEFGSSNLNNLKEILFKLDEIISNGVEEL